MSKSHIITLVRYTVLDESAPRRILGYLNLKFRKFLRSSADRLFTFFRGAENDQIRYFPIISIDRLHPNNTRIMYSVMAPLLGLNFQIIQHFWKTT